MTKDQLISSTAERLKNDPESMIQALKETGIPYNHSSESGLVDAVAVNLVSNPKFQAKVIEQASHSNVAGETIQSISEAVGNIFGTFRGRQERLAEEERTRQELYRQLAGKKKSNLVPVVIIGGVLLIGTIVVYFSLKGKKG